MGRASTSTTCTPIAITFMSALTVDLLDRAVVALERCRHDRPALLVVEDACRPDGGRAPVDGAAPLEQDGVLDGGVDVLRPRDRAVVRHQRGHPALERVERDLRQLRGAERS